MYYVILFPSPSVQDEANSFRKRFDSHYALIPPHIKLTGPFDWKDNQLQSLIESLDQLAVEQSPVVLEIYKADSFRPLSHKIFFKVRKHETLDNLNQKICQLIDVKKDDTQSYVPHITIAQDLPEAEHDDLLGQLRMNPFTHLEEINEFHLIKQGKDEKWETMKTFYLKGD
ncbi:2'-5' RNA ligase family protein [Alkalihalobacillus sp. FSL W8-0930]